jgi:uncharacterized SAM-binding protein YcdF (DUF218 family)
MVMLSFVATILLVPPANLVLLALAGWLLWRRRAGRILTGLALAGLLVLAMPLTGDLLTLESERFAAPPADIAAPAAIVILSGDVNRVGDGPPAFDVGALTLERERAGAALQRATGLPVLVSGGVIGRDQPPLAELMTHSLGADFIVPVRWQESASRNTWENARNSAALLRAAGIRSVFLVTHAWHMRRALIAFRHFGLQATPAPVPFSRALQFQPAELIPRAGAWAVSYYALHELMGCAWYTLLARS